MMKNNTFSSLAPPQRAIMLYNYWTSPKIPVGDEPQVTPFWALIQKLSIENEVGKARKCLGITFNEGGHCLYYCVA
jgi:hypothetical protein